MKIAFYNLTTTTKSGGIETFNWEMAKVLRKRGYAVHIYGGRGNFPFDRPANTPVHTYPYIRRESFPNFGTRFRRFMERLSFGLFTLRDLIKGKYHYIYLIKPYDIPVALLASAFSKARVIFGSSGTEFFPGYTQLVKKVDYFFACSEFNASQIEEYCGIRPLVLPNGVDTELFKPLSPDPELIKTLELNGGEIVVMTVGRLVGLKGIKYAIGAVEKLLKRGFRVRYLIIGEGEERKKLEVFVKNLQRERNIFFLGNIINSVLPRYYSLSTLAVFPSIADEAFGISIAEALACGVPIVSTNMGGIPELVGDAGILVPPKDEDALANAIETLIANNELRRDLGIKGRNRIDKKFSWDSIAEKFEEYILQGET